jgi:hypothetical protein
VTVVTDSLLKVLSALQRLTEIATGDLTTTLRLMLSLMSFQKHLAPKTPVVCCLPKEDDSKIILIGIHIWVRLTVVIAREAGDYTVATSMTPPELCQVHE